MADIVSETLKSNQLNRRSFLKFLGKAALGTGATVTGLTAATEFMGRMFGRQEKWPDAPFFNKFKNMFESYPKSGTNYTNETRQLVDELVSEQKLPDNISGINFDIYWRKDYHSFDGLQIFQKKSKPPLQGFLIKDSSQTGTETTPDGIKKGFAKISNESGFPFGQILLGIEDDFEPTGKAAEIPYVIGGARNRKPEDIVKVSHTKTYSIDFVDVVNLKFGDKKPASTKHVIDVFLINGDEVMALREVAIYYDQDGKSIASRQYFWGQDKKKGNVAYSLEDKPQNLYLQVSDWYNNKAKEAGK